MRRQMLSSSSLLLFRFFFTCLISFNCQSHKNISLSTLNWRFGARTAQQNTHNTRTECSQEPTKKFATRQLAPTARGAHAVVMTIVPDLAVPQQLRAVRRRRQAAPRQQARRQPTRLACGGASSRWRDAARISAPALQRRQSDALFSATTTFVNSF